MSCLRGVSLLRTPSDAWLIPGATEPVFFQVHDQVITKVFVFKVTKTACDIDMLVLGLIVCCLLSPAAATQPMTVVVLPATLCLCSCYMLSTKTCILLAK